MITAINAFEGGYCRQLLAMVDRRSWRIVRFQAVFLALKHETEGWVLVDAGYGLRFDEATSRFPYRFYRWATPTTTAETTTSILERSGIRAEDIRHVIVTHFHADHIGGLSEFPNAHVHYHADALEPLQRLPAWRQVRAAFLPQLVPEWLAEKARPVARAAFSLTADLPFPVHDLFGDGSLRLVYLPGHAPGQIGLAYNSPAGQELYVADAFWRDCQLSGRVDPLSIAMHLQWDAVAYRRTVAQLREVHRLGRYRITACHDDGTADRINQSPAQR
jgi:glyoxylase-like metal-dependent hydrolase (beta-lactamase superfamily II)